MNNYLISFNNKDEIDHGIHTLNVLANVPFLIDIKNVLPYVLRSILRFGMLNKKYYLLRRTVI